MSGFTVLGEITVEIDGEPVDLGSPRERLVLAALLMDVNRPVPADHLVARMWGDDAPPSAAATLRSYMSRLRSRGIAIDRRATGYALIADARLVDVYRFHDLVTRARVADDADAASLFEQALALW